MSVRIDLAKSAFIELKTLEPLEVKTLSKLNKGWSYSYVYDLKEVRDVFIALTQFNTDHQFELLDFFRFCQEINLPFAKTKWTSRRLLENLNALKNFGLIDSNSFVLEIRFESGIGEQLSPNDLLVFKHIYFDYFRFKEIFSWFINPVPQDKFDFIESLSSEELLKTSGPRFFFSNKSRFTDSFIQKLENATPVYYINEANEDLMRFWDVFVKWGLELGVIEKLNLRNLDVKTVDNKSLVCVFVVDREFASLDLLMYLNENYQSNYIYLPDLVLELATKFRQRVETIHTLITDQYRIHKEYLSFERTSEIFVKKQEIKNGDKIFFLKYNDSYISHIIIRR